MMNVDAKILNKILANNTLISTYTITNKVSFQVGKDGSQYANQ
jgi:hypothetical protein